MVILPIKNHKEKYTITASKIIAVGLNYRDHVAEAASLKVKSFTSEPPTEPALFPKTPNAIIGTDEPIVIPKFLDEYHFEDLRVDYEAELAFIFKDKSKNVSKADALNHILGFTCLNDVSQRNIQNADRSGWFRGKSLDTFAPVGPQLVLTKDIGDVQNLKIYSRLNGKTMQSSNTKNMIWTIPELVEFVTKNFTMMPGDIVATGTPSGVGRMKHGDVVEIEIENIGILRNPVIEENKQ